MWMIVGLHNPERAYSGTRHNVGAGVVRSLAGSCGVRLRRAPKAIRCHQARVVTGGTPALLALPRTSMNVCGPPIRDLLGYYKVEPSRLLIVHDDIDLPFGRLRLREGRGHGGHNGVRSIIAALGTPSFWRLKVGVGRPPDGMNPADFVLSRFFKGERLEVASMVDDAAEVIEVFVNDPERGVAMAGGRRPDLTGGEAGR